MYKKIYIEITNTCNLSCPFCIKNSRKKKFLSEEEFKLILDKIKNYTSYIYLHVLGEPLLHKDINSFIDIAKDNFKINITTNGYLIKNIENNHNIRQVNISLHSFNEVYKKTLQEYLNDIFEVINNLKKETKFSLRLWVKSNYSDEIIKYLNKMYNKQLDNNNLKENVKLEENVFLNVEKEFIWPSLDNNYYNENGTCYGLKDHIGILVDGTIIPCCLDSKGIIKLGNIYTDDLKNVIDSKRYQEMLKGFKNNKKCEELCKKCNFIN